MNFLKAILFGIIEGITEWLPVSSTAHLKILNLFFPLEVSEGFFDVFDVVIQLGEEFNPLNGVTATDKEDGEIKDIEVVRENVDINLAGEYEVTFKATDSSKASSIKTIKVIVNDPPKIYAEDKTIILGENFEELSGVSAIDKEDEDITDKIEVIKEGKK